jgi:hypothetical protein
MDKPHRVLINRVTGYADEAAAFLRRRRLTRKPFARVWWPGERGDSFDATGVKGRELFLAAATLIELGRQ